MSSPVEFRSYVRLATVEDWANGLQAARLPVIRDGQKALEWSPWIQIPVIKEGDTEAPDANVRG